MQGTGDTRWMPAGTFVGTRNRGLQLGGVAIRLTGPSAGDYDVEYQTHVGNGGLPPVPSGEFSSPYRDGVYCGTRGQGLAVEGLRLRVVARH